MILTTPHIDEVLKRCLEGDQRAQMEIYKKYHKAMFNTALRIVKDPMEAEDVMQEGFIKAFSKLKTFKGNSTFGAWLKKIIVNRSINAYQKKQKYAEVSYNDAFKEHAEVENGINEADLTDGKVKKVLEVLKTLKENYRLILTLHLIEGYDYDEICEILDISSASCRTTVSRAKESLRKKLFSYER